MPEGGKQNNRGMGRGLAAILPQGGRDQDGLRHVPLDLIAPNPKQPRSDFPSADLMALAESVKAKGVLQPIVVRPLASGSYELVAGERRLRAAKAAGLDKIPALVRHTEDSEQLELALMENMARQDLNPVEEARACATLVDDLGITKEEMARRLGRNRVTISNLIRLLGLPDEVLDLLAQRELTEGHGRALLVCKDRGKLRDLARAAAANGWTVKETERRAREAAGRPDPERKARVVEIHPDLQDAIGAAEDALTAALGHEVHIKRTGDSFRADFALEHPRDGLELAERLLRRRNAA